MRNWLDDLENSFDEEITPLMWAVVVFGSTGAVALAWVLIAAFWQVAP